MNYNTVPEFLYLFLRKIKIKTNFLQIRELYSQHPLPHSFRALSDTLDKLHIEHIVCVLSFKQLFKIEGPFIAITGNKEFPFCFLVLNVMQFPILEKLRYWIKGIGSIFSMLIVFKTFYNQNLMQRFCHPNNHFDCNEIFRASGAKLLGWISLGELSLAYFLSSLVWGIFIAESPVSFFLLLDSFALLFVVYSLIWQAYHLRWCILCLVIDLILISDLLFEIIVWNITPKNFSYNYFNMFNYSLLFCLCLLGIRQLVRIVEQNQKKSQIEFKHELLLKYPDIFWKLLAQQFPTSLDSNVVPTISNHLGSKHTITIIMNPFCSKCAQIHNVISSLKKYKINLVFLINEEDIKAYQTTLSIISSGIVNKWEETTHIIKQWYMTHKLPTNQFIHPWAQNYLKAQINYCKEIHIEGTPTILIDNRMIPEIYDINELCIIL